MKNISFKRKEAAIRGLENYQPEKKTKSPRNWDRLIYFFLLIVILFFLVRYLINSFFYIEADGQILFDNIEIRNTNDCRIIEYFIEVGQEVCVGDSLFSFIPDKPIGNFNSFGTYEFALNQQKKNDISWSEKESFQVNEEIKVNSFIIQEKIKLRELYTKELDRIRNEVMLDVLPRNRMDDQLSKINQISYEIETLKGKNNLLIQKISELEKLKRELNQNTSLSNNGQNSSNHVIHDGRQVFYSPLEGTITNIMKSEFEVALKDEQILAIHKPHNVYIKAFFKQEDLKSLEVNDMVTIMFPDGTVGQGMIKRFYFTTYRLPEEFQKKYEPTTRSLSADVLPATDEDLLKWRMYWKMGVKIKKTKY
jgi:multidrug resistance efflux pump